MNGAEDADADVDMMEKEEMMSQLMHQLHHRHHHHRVRGSGGRSRDDSSLSSMSVICK